jgi:PAS domain S-box-containing protein
MKQDDPQSQLKWQLTHQLVVNKRLAQVASAIAILVGCLALFGGWGLNFNWLKNPILGSVEMKANTALCFILAGISLGLQTRRRSFGISRSISSGIAKGCAIAVGSIGALTLSQYLFGWNWGIDELLFSDLPPYPGRMGDNTALNFVLIAIALWLLGQKTRISDRIYQLATILAAAIALLALIGYAYKVQIFYRFFFYSTSMALVTALTFSILCLGILSIGADRGLMQTVTSNLTGGVVARKLLLIAIAVPPVLGWLILQGLLVQLYNFAFSLALLVILLTLILVLVIWFNARWLNQTDYKRRASEEMLQLALRGSRQGIWDWNLNTEVLTWDDRCKEIFGLPADFAITYQHHLDALHPDDRQRVADAATTALQECTEFKEEYRTFYPDGTMHWILARGGGYYNPEGEPYRMSGTVLDISDRKATEEKIQRLNQDLAHRVDELQTLFDVIPAGIAVAEDLRGNVIRVNSFFQEILGVTSETNASKTGSEADALPFKVLQDGQEIPGEDLPIQVAMAQGIEIQNSQIQIVRSDGAVFDLLGHAKPLFDERGVVRGCVDVHLNITDLKKTETALKQSEARFQRLVANVPGVIYQYAVHPDGTDRFTYVSSRSQELYEYEPEVLIENFSPIWQMVHPDDVERVRSANIASAQNLEPLDLEFRLLPPSGKLKWVQVVSLPERQPNGDTVWDGIVLDISDRKCARLNEQFLNELDLRLRQLDDAQAMIWEAVSSLGQYLNVDRCFWHEIDWENRVAIVERNWRRADVTDLAGTYPLENFFTSEQFDCLASGQAIVVPDVTTHPHTAPYAQSYQPLTVAAFVAVPCIQLGQWVANLSINCTTARNWREDEVALLQETVARLWSIIEQTRAIDALRASEERYRTLFESIDQGFCICQMLFDENGTPSDYRFLEINPAFAQMTGLQQATGKTARELVPNLEDFWVQTYGQVALTGESIRFENQAKTMNRWFDVSAFPFGEVQERKFALLFTNITTRKQAAADLKERNDHIQILYETTRDLLSTYQPLALVDTLFVKLKSLIGLDVYFNYMVDEEAHKLHLMFYGGITDEMARSIEWLEISQAVCGTVAEERCQIVQPNLQQSVDPKTELVRSLGLTAYSCQPLISQGKLFGTLGFGSLTRTNFKLVETQLFQAICDRIAIALDRAELVSSLQKQTEELKQLNRLKDEFLAALSHELRTPLNPILGWTKLLQTQKLTAVKTNEALLAIERNAKQQIALVDDLLDISRVVRGKFNLTVQPVDLVAILNAAIETVHLSAIAKSIALEIHFSSDAVSSVRTLQDGENVDLCSLTVMGDPVRLQQIFWNLLANAIKFTPNNGRVDVWLEKVTETGKAEQESGEQPTSNQPATNQQPIAYYAQIRFTDTGIGIAPEFLPHVFDRFRQADGSSTRSYGGLGLGLSLVKHLVELHGGIVEAESPGEGQGATFKVKLPLRKELSSSFQAQSNLKQSQALDTDELSSTSTSSNLLRGIRVLLVDDEPDNLDLLKIILTQEGAIATAVATGKEALEIASTNSFDLLISDIGMPEINGYQLLQQLRALSSQANNSIIAIALTAFAQREDEEKALSTGFQAYFSKPFDLVELVDAIAKLLNRTSK